MIRFSSLARFSRNALNPDTRFSNDIARQLAWLTEQAKAKGYQDARELARKDRAEFVRLATEWREHQPQSHRRSLRGRLSARVRGLAARLPRALRKREY